MGEERGEGLICSKYFASFDRATVLSYALRTTYMQYKKAIALSRGAK